MLEKLWEEFWLGLRNLARYKLRSFLTTLGIIFGIASVISMMAVGTGAKTQILEQIGQLGINNVIVNSKKPPETQQPQGQQTRQFVAKYGVTFKDYHQIRDTVPGAVSILPVHFVHQPVWYRARRLNIKVLGVVPDYQETFNLVPKLGRRMTDMDNELMRPVCVVREQVLRDLHVLEDPLKLDLKIGGNFFRVVGVLPSVKYDTPTSKALNIEGPSSEIYIPYETVLNVFGTVSQQASSGSFSRTEIELDQVVVRTASSDDVVTTAEAIARVLDKFHEEKDYELVVPLDLLKKKQETQKTFNIVLMLIAAISLLVGGIGIVNIMLATITERTREIGIRRAVGAKRKEIVIQFLMETLAIATVGGIFGCLLGVIGVEGIAYFTEWKTVITGTSVVVSMGISCMVGILFGIYPAMRAAKMDPIQALRWE